MSVCCSFLFLIRLHACIMYQMMDKGAREGTCKHLIVYLFIGGILTFSRPTLMRASLGPGQPAGLFRNGVPGWLRSVEG